MKSPPTFRDMVMAVIQGQTDCVRAMRAEGVSVTQPDDHGWLPLHRAASNDREELVRLLVEWGSPLEATGTDQWTPLHSASVSRSPRAVKALLDLGANLEARSVSGKTPLHLAVGPTIFPELLETVRALVAAGANREAQDDDGLTPLDEARAIGNPELPSILECEQR